MLNFLYFFIFFIFFSQKSFCQNLTEEKNIKRKIKQKPISKNKQINKNNQISADNEEDKLTSTEQEKKTEEEEKKEEPKEESIYFKIKNSFNDLIDIKTSVTDSSFEILKKPMEDERRKITFQLKIGGLLDFQYGHFFTNSSVYKDENFNYVNGLGYAPQMKTGQDNSYFSTFHNFMTRAKIDISPEIKFKNFRFGAFFAIPLIKNFDSDPKTASQEYLYADLGYIKIEAGSTFSSSSKMRIDPSKIASGTGGVYGDWWRYSSTAIFDVGNAGGVNNALNQGFSPVFIIYPTLPNEAGFTGGNVLSSGFSGNLPLTAQNLQYAYSAQGIPTQGARSNKISIYTKRLLGLQLGFSYSPDTNATGFINRTILNSGTIYGGVKNYISLGLNYKKQITNSIAFAGSFTYETGKYYAPISNYTDSNADTQASNLGGSYALDKKDLNAFALGFMFVYGNVAISYAYNNWLNSLMAYSYKNPAGSFATPYDGHDRAYSHVGGVSFNFGNMNASVQYMYSNYIGNVASVLSIGTDYKLVSLKYIRIEPYIEYNFITLNPKSFSLIQGNSQTYEALTKKGHVFITGLRFRF